MDYEKKYKESLERAKNFEEKYGGGYAGYIFPELAESEDERIKKIITDSVFYQYGAGVEYKDVLDYLDKLEKQKEQKPNFDTHWENGSMVCEQKEPHYTKRNALFDKCVENCDPKTVEEVNKRVDDIMNMPELSAFEQALTNFIGYWEDDEEHWPSQFVKKHGKHILDIAREELKKEQKPADLSKMMVHKEPYIAPVPTPTVADEQKPEWSEEDKKMFNALVDYVEYPSCWNLKCPREKLVAFIKSLRPSWKPSEEHLSALLAVFNDPDNIGSQTCQLALTDLYEQLKKL